MRAAKSNFGALGRTWLVGLVVVAISGGRAIAQPATAPAGDGADGAAKPPAEPGPGAGCQVRFVRAPDNVRAVVERWLRAEPRCGEPLEVRIVPTDGGYYVLVRDDGGHIHERVVPDPASAGVLIASWAADDTIVASMPPASPVPPTALPAPLGTPTATLPEPLQLAPAPPSTTGAADIPAVRVPSPQLAASLAGPTAVSPLGTSLGVLWQAGAAPRETGGAGWGVRTDVDLAAFGEGGRWLFGAAGSISIIGRYHDDAMHTTVADLQATEVDAVAHVGPGWQFGRWQIAAALGAGLQYASGDEYVTTVLSRDVSTHGVSAIAQASLMVSLRIDIHLALTVGALATAYSQRYAAVGDNLSDLARVVDAATFGGIRWAW